MYNVNKNNKIAVVDFEYSFLKENIGYGPMFGFVIVKDNNPCGSTFTFNISDFPDEKSMIQCFFRSLDSLNYNYVLISYLDAFLSLISHRAEALGIPLRELVDPDNKYPDKNINIVVERTTMDGDKIKPLDIWKYTYTVELPTNFKFLDMVTFYNNNKKREHVFTLNEMAKAELGKPIKYVGKPEDCFSLSTDEMMSFCVDDTKLLHEVLSSMMGKMRDG